MLTPETDRPFGRFVFGIDEVGLGPLAGPLVVVCCAIDLDNVPFIPLRDSKKLSCGQREKIFAEILSHKDKRIHWGVGIITAPDLDRIGIPEALASSVQTAFRRCQPPFKPDHVLIDGNRHYDLPYPTTSIIKGDNVQYTIAMASIIAKVLRDRWMCILSRLYPQFGFEQHKGYGTKHHIHVIQQGHISPHHRRSYAPLRQQRQTAHSTVSPTGGF